MLCVAPFSPAFWCVYLCGGLTDIMDGWIARKQSRPNAFGAKLDSAADFVFAGAIAIFAVIHIEIPVWLWLCISGVAFVRLTGYGIGFYKYRAFSALHSYANKMTGVCVFMAPMLYKVTGLAVTGVILSAVAFASALEEVMITIKSKELNRDCKGVWLR